MLMEGQLIKLPIYTVSCSHISDKFQFSCSTCTLGLQVQRRSSQLHIIYPIHAFTNLLLDSLLTADDIKRLRSSGFPDAACPPARLDWGPWKVAWPRPLVDKIEAIVSQPATNHPGLATNSIFSVSLLWKIIDLPGGQTIKNYIKTILFRSSQQLPRLRLGPLKGFLSWHGAL